MSELYNKVTPGVFEPWEQEILDAQKKMVESVENGVKVPGGTVSLAEILNGNSRWVPENPIFTDPEAAKKAGYPDVYAFPGSYCPRAPLPGYQLGQDVGDKFYYVMADGEMRFYQPLMPGTELEVARDFATMTELTPEGGDLRLFETRRSVTAYNKAGEPIMTQIDTMREGYRTYADPAMERDYSKSISEWTEYFPDAHYTTDEDWDYIRSLWKNEFVRGADILYWEDVGEGDETPIYTPGPITCMDMARLHAGPHQCPDMRNFVMDPEACKSLYRDRFGNYYFLTAIHYCSRNIPGARMLFYNDTVAQFCAKAITNYVGDHGFITRFYWTFKPFFKELQIKSEGADILSKVPSMAGRGCEIHGADGDCPICKGYVTKKYIDDDGNHLIDIASWAEELGGQVIQVCEFTVKLPSRGE